MEHAPLNLDDLLDWIVTGLRDAADELDNEQSPRGLDALDEQAIGDVLERALRGRGIGVLRERAYPGAPGTRPQTSARERCDFVLTPCARAIVRDPVLELKEQDARAGTLFADAPMRAAEHAVEPASACWLEVKVLGQHEFHRGVPVPNARYASVLTRGVREDLGKLSRDPRIERGVLLLVVFCESEAVARHDVMIALHRALDRGVAFRSPRGGGFAISDRIGNTRCSIWLVESVRGATPAES